jgi:response regulator RpfG family c-di-GMP phosphodiesterase
VKRILVVDDDRLLCERVRSAFEQAGHEAVEAHHVIDAERALAVSRPDAIVLDVGLPGIDGLYYCRQLRDSPRERTIPIVLLSGAAEDAAAAEAAGAGAFLRKPFDTAELVALVARMLGVAPLVRAVDPAAVAEQTHAADVHRLIEIGQRHHELLDEAYHQTVTALAAALESRDFGTSAHSRRVTAYATRLTLDMAPSLLDDPSVEWGFLLHDVGKIGIPDRILLKGGPLSGDERRQMEGHALLGERLLAHVPLVRGEGIRIIRSHHERWDGDGYPDRLAGERIPLGARIFAAVDALDAMTDRRPYRAPLDWHDAIAELRTGAGRQFDPDVIDAVEACEDDLHRIHALLAA